jgi:hypothetical protein
MLSHLQLQNKYLLYRAYFAEKGQTVKDITTYVYLIAGILEVYQVPSYEAEKVSFLNVLLEQALNLIDTDGEILRAIEEARKAIDKIGLE